MSEKTRIIVTGAYGQLGSEIKFLSSQFPDYQFFYSDVDTLDITNWRAVYQYFDTVQPHFCVNCAAYTAVDKAESEPQKATKINVTAVKYLAKACLKHQARLIHLSSDYVYHNSINRPLVETDKTNPQSVYALTKLKGDKMALSVSSENIIIRSSWIYSSFGHNFLKTMLRLGRERNSLNIVYDQVGVPAYARDIATAILAIIGKLLATNHPLGGVYHFAPSGVTCWYDYARTIFELENIDCQVNPILTRDYPTPAKRPSFSLLNCEKIQTAFDLKIPYWKDSVRKCLEVIRDEG